MAFTLYLLIMLVITNDGEFGALILLKLEGILFLIIAVNLIWSYFIKSMEDSRKKQTQLVIFSAFFLIEAFWFITQQVMKYI